MVVANESRGRRTNVLCKRPKGRVAVRQRRFERNRWFVAGLTSG
jgi:hypothetical protein